MIELDNELYSATLGVRKKELNLLWTRFNIYFLLNGGFLLAVLSVGNDSILPAAGG